MALAPNALCTVEQAKAYLRDPGANATLIEDLVNDVSAAIARWTERQFHPEGTVAAPVAKTFRYDGRGRIDFAQLGTELRLIAVADDAVVLDEGETYATQLVAASYGFRLGRRNRDGTYFGLSLPRLNLGSQLDERNVTVRGVWGTSTALPSDSEAVRIAAIPPDVNMAARITIHDQYRNPGGAASVVMGDLTTVEPAETSVDARAAAMFPPDARDRLNRYRRTTAP